MSPSFQQPSLKLYRLIFTMDPPPDKLRDSSHCASCSKARINFCTNSCFFRNITPPIWSHALCRLSLSSLHVNSLTRALNRPIRWQSFLHFTLMLMLLLRTGFAEASCTADSPYVGYRLVIPDDQLKRQSIVLSEKDCVDTCCLKKYCDAVWILEGSCYHARCKTNSQCIPVKAQWPHDDESNIVYVMRRTTPLDDEDSSIDCNPHAKWDTCPVMEHCSTLTYQCECDLGMTRNFGTNHCESVPSDKILEKLRVKRSKSQLDTTSNRFHGNQDPSDPEDQKSWTENLRFCKSDGECKKLEYCFGLLIYSEGVCQCEEGYQWSQELDVCQKEYLEGDTINPTTNLSPQSMEHIPVTPPDISTTYQTTPGTTSSNGTDSPKQSTAITADVGGIAGVEVAGSHPGDELVLPDKKNTEDTMGHQENKTEPNNTTERVDLPKTESSPSPRPETLTHSDMNTTQSDTQGNTDSDKGLDTLTEKDLPTVKLTTTPKVTQAVTEAVTTPKPLTTIPPVTKLTVSAGEEKTLQLPDEDHVTLFAYVVPETQPSGNDYRYEWQVIEDPDGGKKGEMNGEHSKQLQLAGLSAGVFRFKVEVQGDGSYGSATVNVTVLPPPRLNQPPKAVINPTSQDVFLPNPGTFLDGADSTDDDKIMSYHWEEVEGPVREQKITGDTQTLKLTDLVPGSYVISLTVTDSDGATDSALANVTVKEETDNPPVAKAGKDVIIKLPVNSAILYGNSSFDDHPDVTYVWSKERGPAADMSGSSSAILHLDNLEEGTYVFRLTLKDSKDQTDLDEATVIVKPENNLPPTADAGPDKELSLPDDSTTLDASDSKDDLGITTYHWQKVSGPNEPEITDADQVVATVSGLMAGHYLFKLTVGDKHGATDSDTVDVIVKKEINIAPVAHAGPDISIQLPNDVVELDGSESTDDKGIVSYEWKRNPKSPAAGSAIGNTAHEAVLKLRSLVAGTYYFTLNVTDAKGASNTDTVVVTVAKDPHKLNLVEITFDVEVSKFTQQDKVDMVRSLAVLLSIRDEDVNIQEVFHTPNEQLQVVFYATNATSHSAIPGPTVVKILTKKKLSSETDLLKFRVLEVDTMICQRNCSNHGICNPYTKLCVCESFWMENYLRTWLGDGQSNCDWSILYVIIAACFLAIGVAGLCWLCICCIKRRRKKVKRRRRYNLLSQDLDGQESMEMLPKKANEHLSEMTRNNNGKQSSSIMISESDDDSDEETTLFDSKKRQGKNGKANGSVQTVQPRKKRPFPLISSNNRTEKL
ncbi:dyslexia-associated protein KIAA0319-like protein isoform X3 [Asterias rubens]|uniref:dyslexia-associated protein KIAA0319-like protein isoform X3 n=1 Tax=Asterias rubens TaxID=7604 RepID=UPI001455226F|nr:dyslexia-associated protein KIAA0319-like protein isoform X3 [Asterias rubens]